MVENKGNLEKLEPHGGSGAGKKLSSFVGGRAFFWVLLSLLGALLYVGLLREFSRLPRSLVEGSLDLTIYFEAGEDMLSGVVPYRDFFIEYPPASLPFFVPPALLATSVEGYAPYFASEMALVLVAALVLLAYAARRSLDLWWPVSAAVFVAGALMLYPVAVTRYDAVVALALAGACAGVSFGRTRPAMLLAAWASLGLGAAAKLVPALVTLPLALLGDSKDGARTPRTTARGAARGFMVFLGVVAAFFLPAFVVGGGGLVEGFEYHADRGLQLESLGASALMGLGRVEGTFFEFGATEVRGRGAELLGSASLPVTGLLLAATAAVMYREYRGGRYGPGQFPRFAAAFVLAFLLGSKVLSPQYVIWLLPLVPLSASGAWGVGVCAVFLGTCWATTQIYPLHYGQLVHLRPPATGLLLGRNLLLVVLWALMLSLPANKEPSGTFERGSQRGKPA